MAEKEVWSAWKHCPAFHVVAVVVFFGTHFVTGTPCTDGSHTCTSTETCLETNGTSGFTCGCVRKDVQRAANGICVIVPDSQRLYLLITFDFTVVPRKFIEQPEIPEAAVGALLQARHIEGFKGVKMDDNFKIMNGVLGSLSCSVIFSQTVTSSMREEVALFALDLERTGFIAVINFNVSLLESVGIFNSKEDISTGTDAINWCSTQRLFTCPNNSACNDTGIRYECLCFTGYFKEGSECKWSLNKYWKRNRLANGSVPHEGRLEIYTNGAWRTVCKEGFESQEASVVCRQLDYPGRGAEFFTDIRFGQGTSEIFTDDLECSGKETLLSDCAKGRQHNCSHEQDVGVQCDAECADDLHFGPNCTLACDCFANNSESCERNNGTCLCKSGWAGITCEQDVDECRLEVHNCSEVHEMCQNTAGGYVCECGPHAKKNSSGTCVGIVTLIGPSRFKTDGTSYLLLECSPGNLTTRVRFSWNVQCDVEYNGTCSFKPQPPKDDGLNVTCTVTYSDGQTSTSFLLLDLYYPPTSHPSISLQGYQNGEVIQAGNSLIMTCSVQGGKPLVSSVVFWCPGHADQRTDIRDSVRSQVQSVLMFNTLRASDNNTLCLCTAVWEDTDWYSYSSSKRLIVNGTDSDTGGPPVNVPLIAGLTVTSTGVFIGIVIAIVVWRKRRVAATSDNLSVIDLYNVANDANIQETGHYAETDDVINEQPSEERRSRPLPSLPIETPAWTSEHLCAQALIHSTPQNYYLHPTSSPKAVKHGGRNTNLVKGRSDYLHPTNDCSNRFVTDPVENGDTSRDGAPDESHEPNRMAPKDILQTTEPLGRGSNNDSSYDLDRYQISSVSATIGNNYYDERDNLSPCVHPEERLPSNEIQFENECVHVEDSITTMTEVGISP